MDNLEILANEIASLSNQSMLRLVEIIVRDYPTRADALDTAISAVYWEENLGKQHLEV